jgi:hypothetical protein
MFAFPGRSAARSPCEAVRCRAGVPVTCDSKKPGSRFCEAALRKSYAPHRARDTKRPYSTLPIFFTAAIRRALSASTNLENSGASI